MVKDSLECPHCGTYSTITCHAIQRLHQLYTCDKCDEVFLLIVDQNEIIDQYPKRTPKIDSSIPTDEPKTTKRRLNVTISKQIERQ